MTYQRWLRQGTVTIAGGALSTVTGSLTTWLQDVRPGDGFSIDGTRWVEIASVASNTSLTLAEPWPAAVAAGSAYRIDRRSLLRQLGSDLGARVTDMLSALKGLPAIAGAGDALKQVRVNAGGTAYELFFSVAARERLSAPRTYYVRSNGNDANTGLANTVGGAFLTIGRAFAAIAQIDLAGYDVTIQLAPGTYAAASALGAWVGNGVVTIRGDVLAPGSYNVAGVVSRDGANVSIQGITLAPPAGGIGLLAQRGRIAITGVCAFAATAGGYHMQADEAGSSIGVDANYTISGLAAAHIVCSSGGRVRCVGRTVTLAGGLTFASAFFVATRMSLIEAFNNTFSAGASGSRYYVEGNSVLYTNNAFSSTPGSTAGVTTSGGVVQ